MSFEAEDHYGRTPLHFAAGGNAAANVGDSEMFNFFVQQISSNNNVNINARDAEGWTPLMWASRAGLEAEPIVRELIQTHEADVWPQRNNGEWSALKLARLSGWKEPEVTDLLAPPENARERIGDDGNEVRWDMAHHDTSGSFLRMDYLCENCFMVRTPTFSFL